MTIPRMEIVPMTRCQQTISPDDMPLLGEESIPSEMGVASDDTEVVGVASEDTEAGLAQTPMEVVALGVEMGVAKMSIVMGAGLTPTEEEEEEEVGVASIPMAMGAGLTPTEEEEVGVALGAGPIHMASLVEE
jgi:hypothetical protein